MKESKKCPKCGSTRIGKLDWLPAYSDSEARGEQIIGSTLAHKPKWTLGTPRDAHSIEAMVCTICGFLEYYAKEPDKIPFEKMDNFHWVNEQDK